MAEFSTSRATERQFASALRRVARMVAEIMAGFVDGADIRAGMSAAMEAYSEALGPWADRVVTRMLADIRRRNERAWGQRSKEIGRLLRSEVAESAVGQTARALHAEQVRLIKSLPLEAAERAQKLAMQAATDGTRAAEVAEEIARTQQVTESRAMLIARTELAKSNAAITQSRAQSVGATHYVWRTAGDGDVRDTHAALEGQVYAWTDPPEIPGEGRHHPGEFPNCRCYAEPVIA